MASTLPPPVLDPLDFLALDALLDEEERAIRDTVRQFVREQVVPEVGDWFEQGILPREMISELAKLGLFGMHLEGYGLPGASAVAYGLACLELEAGDSGIRSAVSVQGSLAMFAIWRWGSEEQKERWLPAMHTGEVIGCFGLTEPDAGSDPGTMRTHARQDGTDWVLNGAKMWITNGTIADIAIVWARTDERRDPRLHRREGDPRVLGSRDPQEDLAPGLRDLGARAPGRARPRGEHAAGRLDAARAALVPQRGALRHRLGRGRCRPRVLRGGAVVRQGAHRLRQADLGLPADPAEARGDGARGEPRHARRAAHRPDEGRRAHSAQEHVSLGKMGNVRGALDVCRSARTILGGNGITLEYPVIRHMNNLESVLTYEGTHEVHTLVVGQALTGESAFR